jgi:acyl carrier protein
VSGEDRTDAANVVLETIASVTGCKRAAITPHASLFEDLGLDSASALHLLVELEDAFDIVIGSAEAAQMSTVGDVLDYIARRLPPAG